MNEKTARRLNRLLAVSRPIILMSSGSSYVIKGFVCGTYYDCSLDDLNMDGSVCILKELDDALMKAVPAVISNRIREAAKNRKGVELPHVRAMHYPLGWITPADVVDAASPMINAILDTHNARTLSNYEVYRTACEQGIAVPPED